MEQENKAETQESKESKEPQVTRDLSNVGYPVAPFKFIIMSILTLNLYPVYWAFKNFTVLDTTPVKRPKILAACSAIFFTFTFYWLLKYIEQASERHGNPIKMQKGLLAGAFFFFHFVQVCARRVPFDGVTSEIIDWTGVVISLLILMVPVRAVLKLAETSNPPTPIDFDFTITNYVFMVIGGIITVIGLIGAFMPG